ncbi:hypothetical protein DZC31_24975 [Stenotrophomonas rhizophila]|nr:hypothetical protein DZC31_24975 [Stenotrophomonas rhizophila]
MCEDAAVYPIVGKAAHSCGCCWGCFAALRGQARSPRITTVFTASEVRVGAGLPAKGRKAAPLNQ